MRVLLVTWIDNLAEKLAALNPELEYCAIVVDKVEPAKEILEQVGLSAALLHPMDELKACVEELDYDYVLLVQNKFYDGKIRLLQNFDLPTNKVVSFAALPSAGNWQTERHLRYYKAHAQNFEIFATGTSTTEAGIDIRKFKRKAINFATSSQDRYYNLQIAKAAVSYGGGIAHSVTRSLDLRRIPFTSTFPKRSD